MEKNKVKVISGEVGKFDVDSITVELNSNITSICFDKKDDVTKYVGRYIYLINDNGTYTVEPVESTKK